MFIFSERARPYGRVLFTLLILALSLPARQALACACGCGVFDVTTSSMLPTGPGGTAYVEYDFMNQGQNWSGTSKAPAADNTDKEIRSDFVVAGAQYMFNRDWGIMAQIPYVDRRFVTTENGPVQGFNHDAFGDARLQGVYTGFSPDMSSGVTFGVKLPTGDYRYANLDRDTETGSGSTDLLLGAYHRDQFTPQWNWFIGDQVDIPALTQDGYRPGDEMDGVAGIYYSSWKWGRLRVSPVLQVLGSWRLSDRGTEADPSNTGYKRVLISPGFEFDLAQFRFNAEADLPVYQDVTGNQLVAPVLVKVMLSRSF